MDINSKNPFLCLKKYDDKKTILLVEDNPDDVELTRFALHNEAVNCDLSLLSDGTEGVDYFSTIDNRADTMPDVILLDL